eukprot:7297269-Pyramimonas_sp.AAC.1
MPRPLAERWCLTLPHHVHLENMYVMCQTYNLVRQGTPVSTPGQLRGYVSAAIRSLRPVSYTHLRAHETGAYL